jgi:AbrB family looped-hinge helix DNA binding protein
MTTVLSKNGQIVLPSAVREQLHLEPGQDFEVFIDDEDTIMLRRISRRPNQGLIDHLLAYPYPFEIPPRAKDSTRPISL